ncbi:hypothetical protein [Stenotrophomonas sp.]|nr:hypothetical protein [Stenotrophomonas sp.]
MSSAVKALCRGTVEAQRTADHLLTSQVRTCTQQPRLIALLLEIGNDMRNERYWFEAKQHGWGWPLRWQGWLAYGITFASLAALFFVVPPTRAPGPFMGATGGIILLLLVVCWLKGEPLR